MGDLSQKQSSSVTRITGGDEVYAADVIEENDVKKLRVKSDSAFSPDLKIETEFNAGVVLDDVNYYTIFSRSTSAVVSGFLLKFDDKKVVVRLVIDGTNIFDVDVEQLKELVNIDEGIVPNIFIKWNDKSKTFYFVPSFPIAAFSSVEIEARSKAGESKEYVSSIIQVS